MTLKKVGIVGFLLLLLLSLNNCTDDSETRPDFLDASELYLEITINNKIVKYEGGSTSGESFSKKGDSVFQNYPITYYWLNPQPTDSIAIIWFQNLRNFPIENDTIIPPSLSNDQILEAINLNNWKFDNSLSYEKGISVSLIESLGQGNNNYHSITSEDNHFNISDIYISRLYYSKTDKLSEKEFVVIVGDFYTRLGSKLDTIGATGSFRAILP